MASKLKDEIGEYKAMINDLEDDFRHDLAVHLYSSVLLRKLDPGFPQAIWYRWPLDVDSVPDPRSSKIYSDPVTMELEDAPKVNEMRDLRYKYGVGKKRRTTKKVEKSLEKPVEIGAANGGNGAANGGNGTAEDSEKELEGEDSEKEDLEEEVSEEDSEEYEIESVKEVEEASEKEESEKDEETEKDLESQEEDSGSEKDEVRESESQKVAQDERAVDSEKESDLEILSEQEFQLKIGDLSDDEIDKDTQEFHGVDLLDPKKQSLRFSNLDIIQEPSDYRENLQVEIKAQLQKAVRAKLDKHKISPDFYNEVTDEISNQVCAKIDNILYQHSKTKKSSSYLNWQDILIADLTSTGIIKTRNPKDFYDQCEALFLNPKFNYKYKGIEVDSNTPFDFYDFLDRIDEARGMRGDLLTSEVILQKLMAVKQEADLKKGIFHDILNLKTEKQRISPDKGYVKPGKRRSKLKGETQYEFPTEKSELPEFALKHKGIRIDEDEYYINF